MRHSDRNRLTLTSLAAVVALALALPVAGAQPATTAPVTVDETQQFRNAGVDIDRLQVTQIGGIVVIRGRTLDRVKAEEAGRVAASLGYDRVANLIQILEPVDDVTIQRIAERELTMRRSLDGCSFKVHSQQGVVQVAGKVRYELQKDEAIQILRQIHGVHAVNSTLVR